MAGLPEYLGMGAAVAAIYIGVKYGGQIVHNLQAGKTGVAPNTTAGDQTSTTPYQPVHPSQSESPDQIPDVTYAPPSKTAPPLSLHDQGINVQPPNAEAIHPSHPHDTGTYPTSIQKHAATHVPIPHPSNSPNVAPTTSNHPHKYPHHAHPHSHANCVCRDGLYDTLDSTKPGCGLIGQSCTTQANIGYFNGYETGWTGPQWRKTIPYRQVIASQGMMRQGRVKRALAAGNHEFIPAGFTLSESSVRRGYNNVYSAGT